MTRLVGRYLVAAEAKGKAVNLAFFLRESGGMYFQYIFRECQVSK